MKKVGKICAILFLLLWSTIQSNAQLNAPEKIFLDSATIHPEFGFETEDGYIIGGAEGSCRTATLWRLNEDFQIMDKRSLRHQYYEISEVLDMKWHDSTLEVLTRQLQYEDVVGDEGMKWYSLDLGFEILDSLYIPEVEAYGGIMRDSFWILKTWRDSLIWVDRTDGQLIQSIPFPISDNDLVVSGRELLTWNENSLYRVDSTFQTDTLKFQDPILDLVADAQYLYVLSKDQIHKIDWGTEVILLDSIQSPDEAESILVQPSDSGLVVFTAVNEVYFYDNTLEETNQIQLFYDSVYAEDLHNVSLNDGSILRLGVTQLMTEVSQSLLYGQEFGMIQRFDRNYSEENFDRPELALSELTLIDRYYGSDGIKVSGDTIYIITKDAVSRLQWLVTNEGILPVHSALVATNILYGFNCFSWANSHFISDTMLQVSDTLTGDMEVYEISEFPDGWEARRFFYTAFPNGHYDANFSDNFRSFTLRYIISSARESLDPDLVHIWPNPTMGEINIKVPHVLDFKTAMVLDLQGRIIYSHQLGAQEERIRLPDQIFSGMYILRLQSTDHYLVKKFSVIK